MAKSETHKFGAAWVAHKLEIGLTTLRIHSARTPVCAAMGRVKATETVSAKARRPFRAV
jgi:hypothetical protein